MLYQNTILGVILFTCVVLCVIIHYYGGKYIVDLVTDRESYFNTVLSENIRDSLDNLMNVFLNNELDAEVKKSNKIEEIAINKLKNIMYWQNVIVFTTQIIVAIAFMIAILYLYNMVSNNVIRTSHAIVLVIILGQFLGNFIHVNAGFSHGVIYRFGVINASYDWLNNIFKPTRKREKKEGIEHGEITFEHVKFRYDTNKDEWLFKDLNLKFEAQKRYAIVGRSGSGKTTIMKMLAGLHLPEEGSLYIDDLNIKDADLEYLRENVNYINQRTNMFNESVVYNMLYGNEHVSEEELIQKLKKYDLLKVFDDLPDGVQANANDDDIVIASFNAFGDIGGSNFVNLDSYESMATIGNKTVSESDFVDYANQDFRIAKTSPLYKGIGGTRNFGAIQNQDFEFVGAG